jgi:hypothetical protein
VLLMGRGLSAKDGGDWEKKKTGRGQRAVLGCTRGEGGAAAVGQTFLEAAKAHESGRGISKVFGEPTFLTWRKGTKGRLWRGRRKGAWDRIEFCLGHLL